VRDFFIHNALYWIEEFNLDGLRLDAVHAIADNSTRHILQELADEIGIAITVCHYPPGTSKWNRVEHRLFSFISLTWKGQPLWNYEAVINLIGATRTDSGLRVKAVLDNNEYETGISISDEQMEELRIRRHKTHPAWNYTLTPRSS